MATIKEIQEKLDGLYQEYKDNKSQLNGVKTKEVARLLADMTLMEDVKPLDIAVRLSNFSADITNLYFEALTKSGAFPMAALDEILKAFLAADNDTKKSQFFVQKFVFTVSVIMKNYKEKALQSAQLPRLVLFVSRFAVKSGKGKDSGKNRDKFQKMINHTMGGIYLLDYSGVNQNSLTNIWNVTRALYPDLSSSKYESLITEWAQKYGFLSEQADSAANPPESTQEAPDRAEKKPMETASAPPSAGFAEAMTEKLYSSLIKTLAEERDAVIAAVEQTAAPLRLSLDALQGEIRQNREAIAAHQRLYARIAELEQEINALKEERDTLSGQMAAQAENNAALNEKLKEAYSINSREASLEAEKIRADLTKAFAFLYEDWMEYEGSDVSADNYASLQAIIKKTFRALERNGISFKGNQV